MRGALALVLVCLAVGSAIVLPDARASSLPAPMPLAPLYPPAPHRGGGGEAPGPTPLAAPFGPNVQVSENNTPGNQNEITLAVAPNGRIHMAWNDYRQPNPDYRCGYAYSTDGGATWSANRLFHLAGWDADGDPSLAVDSNNNVYLLCMPFSRSGGGARVVVYKSTNGGVTFGPATIASDTTNGFNDKPWIHAMGTSVFACYTNFVGGSTEFRFTYSMDGGASWAPTRILDRNGQGCTFAHNNAGVLYAAWWRGNAIFAFRSPDGGATWSPPFFVGSAFFTDAPDQRAGSMPALAADPATDTVYAVWTANDGFGTWDVHFSRSTNQATTWAAPISVNDVATGRQFMPWVDVDSLGTIHVNWYDNRDGPMSMRYAHSSNGGVTWSPSVEVTDVSWPTTFFLGDYTAIVADAGGHVNVGWADFRSGENEAYFARSSAVGPPRLARIDVSPPEAWTDADTTVPFTASGLSQYGDPYAMSPSWAATGGSMAANSYVPARVGDWTVWANDSGLSGSALVHVSPGAIVRIDVTPADATITADDVQPYTATGTDAHGNSFAVSPSWGVSAGTITPAGLYTPNQVGVWTVYANQSGVVGTTSVTVRPGALVAITVSPPTATITADDAQRYTATGTDARGNVVPITPTWQATGGAIDAFGLYTPQLAGTWAVFANESGRSGSAEILVNVGRLARIDVSPADRVITADRTLQYTARGYDAKGNGIAVTPAWSASAGAIDSSGLYTPGRVGAHAIVASVGNVSGSTSVTVNVGPLARIAVTPSPVTITADDTQQLTANGYDVRDNALPVTPSWEATCGAVDWSGLYAPGPARLCLVYANKSGLSGFAQITVVPGRVARIDVAPPSAVITADQTTGYTATGWDAKGNAVSFVPAWSAGGDGAIDANGLYTPRSSGMWGIRAAAGSVEGVATVTVTPGPMVRLAVEPPSPTITADDTQQFTVTGFDVRGNPVSTGTLAWSVDADAGRITAGGLYSPQRVGDWTVTARAGGLVGTAQVVVRPGAVAQVVIVPGDAHAQEGGAVAFNASAFDAKGNEVPDAVFQWRVEGTVGTVDDHGGFVATHSGEGRVVVTATGGGRSAEASAPVLVDSRPFWSGGRDVTGFLSIVVVVILLLLVAVVLALGWRRRRRHDPSPVHQAPSPPSGRILPPPPDD